MESDTLQFRIELKDKPLSRRGILSTVSSVFDPLGLVAPFILVGKRILQELCRDGVGWDDEVPDNLETQVGEMEIWTSFSTKSQNPEMPQTRRIWRGPERRIASLFRRLSGWLWTVYIHTTRWQKRPHSLLSCDGKIARNAPETNNHT